MFTDAELSVDALEGATVRQHDAGNSEITPDQMEVTNLGTHYSTRLSKEPT